MAARIGALSGGSRLYIGPDTYLCVEAFCDCEVLGSQEVKNVKEPVPVYWVRNMKETDVPSENG